MLKFPRRNFHIEFNRGVHLVDAIPKSTHDINLQGLSGVSVGESEPYGYFRATFRVLSIKNDIRFFFLHTFLSSQIAVRKVLACLCHEQVIWPSEHLNPLQEGPTQQKWNNQNLNSTLWLPHYLSALCYFLFLLVPRSVWMILNCPRSNT